MGRVPAPVGDRSRGCWRWPRGRNGIIGSRNAARNRASTGHGSHGGHPK